MEAVVADAEEPLGETHGGHQQGDTQEEQHPLAHTRLLWLQVHAQEVDTAGVCEEAFRASWTGSKETGRWAGHWAGWGHVRWLPCPCSEVRSELVWTGEGAQPSGRLWGKGLGLEVGWVVIPEFGVQLYCGQPSFSPCRPFSVRSQSISGLK